MTMDPARIVALARMIAGDHHPRWRDVAESAAAEHIWRASLRFDGHGDIEAWACYVGRLRARTAVAVAMRADARCSYADEWTDPASSGRDDPEARAVAADRLRSMPARARAAAAERICGATWAEAGAALGCSSFTARHLTLTGG